MIRITNWVADIPLEDKRIAYMGEHETCLRQFLLTGEDAARYAGWTFRLDMQFDVSTVTTATTRHTERVEEEREQSMSDVHVNEQTTTLKESGTVTEVAVDCDNTTDIVYLTQESCEEGLLLTWTVLAQHTRLPGRLWATLRAQNADGAIKKSAMMLFTVDKAVQAVAATVPPLSEFEQMERAMDGRLVALEEMTLDAVEAAQTAKANAAIAGENKEQTAIYKEQAESAASTAEAAAEEAIEAAEGVHKSAYDVAVDNGFVGSEKEWLDSLQGATVEEIEALATLATSAAQRANDAAAGVVTIEQNNQLPLKFWLGTEEEYNTQTNNGVDYIHNCLYLTQKDVLDTLHPVGSVYVASDYEIDPNYLFGGTWELIDRGYAPYAGRCNEAFVPTENVVVDGFYITRSGNTVRLRLAIIVNSSMSDTDMELGRFDWDELGFSKLPYSAFHQLAYSDGANGGIVYNVSVEEGVLTQMDVFNATTLNSESRYYIDLTSPILFEDMNPQLCDKHYWRRTA